jgi:DNA-binding PadR family transcriptional regulator
VKRLSDLEMAILGVIGKRAPCTAYAVAREFFNSPSSHWRGSAGAVYPAVRRLHRLGLVGQRRATRLGRPCQLLALTGRGRDGLREWLAPPLPASAAAHTLDPIRTRTYFLKALPPAKQLAFLVDAEEQLRAQFPALEAEVERYRLSGDWFSEQAQRGCLHTLRGRLAWLEEFRQAWLRRRSDASRAKESTP